MEDGMTRKEYIYDHRGNLTGETEGGTLLHGYAYGAMNRLSRVWNGRGEEAAYLYNGLGQRIGREVREGDRILTERYLLDQTRPYHNLLGIEREGAVQTFYYDGNVAAMEDKETGMHYYLQDELGSPLRVSGYGKRAGAGEGTGNRAGNHAAPGYLTYGYDEFGNDLYRELEEAGIPSPYDRQGEEQPFGYTGYWYDEISGTYFAQAREYQPENGRFTAEDVVKGNGAVPETLNRYGYCWGNPVGLVDHNGEYPIWTAVGEYIGNTVRDLGGAVGNTIEEIENTVGDTVAQVYGSVGNAVSDISGSVGNMTQQAGTILGSPEPAAVVGNLITGVGNYAGNEIKDFGMEAGAAAKTVGTYTADDVRRNTAIGGMLAKEIIRDENVYGTVTYGLNASGTLGLLVFDGSAGLSMDCKGNIGIQLTGAIGYTTSSSPSFTGSVFRTITNAPDIYALEREGGCIGGTVWTQIHGKPAYIGGDLVIVGDLNNKPNENYYGFTTSIGTGVASEYGGEVHGEMSYTIPKTKRFNIVDFLINVLNESGCIE